MHSLPSRPRAAFAHASALLALGCSRAAAPDAAALPPAARALDAARPLLLDAARDTGPESSLLRALELPLPRFELHPLAPGLLGGFELTRVGDEVVLTLRLGLSVGATTSDPSQQAAVRRFGRLVPGSTEARHEVARFLGMVFCNEDRRVRSGALLGLVCDNPGGGGDANFAVRLEARALVVDRIPTPGAGGTWASHPVWTPLLELPLEGSSPVRHSPLGGLGRPQR